MLITILLDKYGTNVRSIINWGVSRFSWLVSNTNIGNFGNYSVSPNRYFQFISPILLELRAFCAINAWYSCFLRDYRNS